MNIPVKKTPSRIVGIDYGMARIGLSLSDETKIIATPLITLKTEKKIESTIKKLVEYLNQHAEAGRYQIEAIVVGMPLMMNGKKGVLADEVGHFIERLKAYFKIPIYSWDERLTSVQADRSLREGPFSRKKRAQMVDNVAATLILQNYLDKGFLEREINLQ
jgi:putative Holliday junction resolvase